MALDTETFTMLRDTVARFVAERLVPLEAHVAETNAITGELLDEMRELGLFGLSISPDYGGLGLTMEEEVRIVLELGQTSPAFRSVVGTNIGIGSQSIVIAGSEEQKQNLSSQAGLRRDHRQFRPYRARCRFRCNVA